MILSPKNTSFNKLHKLSYFGKTKFSFLFGESGLVAKTGGYLTASQLEAVRKLISPLFKTQGQFWIRVFPHFSETQKPKEVRMGKGKGGISYWYCPIKVNQLLFEFSSLDPLTAKILVRKVNSKLPFQIQFLKKHDISSKR